MSTARVVVQKNVSCRSAGCAERLADVQLSSRRRHRRFPPHQTMAADGIARCRAGGVARALWAVGVRTPRIKRIGRGEEIVGESIEGRNRKDGHRKSAMMEAATPGNLPRSP
jgi:hypothetical protein